jgi:two-component system CheB/CheR fusion protein
MQSINEELQYTNEELQTSKEELQSINEELTTVNTELQVKVADLSQFNNDMNNMLSSAGISTVFVDMHMRIRYFTPAATDIMNLITSDVGRPVAHLVSNMIGYNNLVADVQTVLQDLIHKAVEVQTNDGKWYTMRIQPYRTSDNVIEGVVITFIDVTEIKWMKNALVVSENRFRRLFEKAKDGIIILDADTGKILNVNQFLLDMSGYSEEQFIKKAIWDTGFFRDIISNENKLLELQKEEYTRYDNLPLETADGRLIDVEFISNVYPINQSKVIQCDIREVSKRTRRRKQPEK